MRIRTELLPNIDIRRFARLSQVVDLNPPYQREGNVWKTETQSALIDSIINGLDIPKLYFEILQTRKMNPRGIHYQYAVIDGKQRVEAILAFLNGDLSLAKDFTFFENTSVEARGLSLPQLQHQYPELAARFLDFELPIVQVMSDSGDLIEEMFQRLNASTSLNAAERRNALQGPTRDAANAIADHRLLTSCSPIRNARYKHRELAAKFLVIEHQIQTRKKILDTKAATLYALFTASRGAQPKISKNTMEDYRDQVEQILDNMSEVFHDEDRLLASIGTMVVYYIAFRDSRFTGCVSRDKLTEFETLRNEASRMPEDDTTYAEQAYSRLREYNSLVQSTNDGSALQRRADILSGFVLNYERHSPLNGLKNALDGELPNTDESEAN